MPQPQPTPIAAAVQSALAGLVDDALGRQLAQIAANAADRKERNRLVIDWAGELMSLGASGHTAAHEIATKLSRYAETGWRREKDLRADQIIEAHRRLHAILRASRGRAIGWSQIRAILGGGGQR